MALARNQIWLGLRPSFPHSGDLLKLHVIRFMVNAFCTDFELKRKKCLWIPRAHFPISIAIKGIGISCSTGFQQPFWKLIGFDPVSSGGEEMTGGGSLVEVAWPADDNNPTSCHLGSNSSAGDKPGTRDGSFFSSHFQREKVVLNHNTPPASSLSYH